MLWVIKGQGKKCLKIEKTISYAHFIVFAKLRSQTVFVFKKFGKFTQVFWYAL